MRTRGSTRFVAVNVIIACHSETKVWQGSVSRPVPHEDSHVHYRMDLEMSIRLCHTLPILVDAFSSATALGSLSNLAAQRLVGDVKP